MLFSLAGLAVIASDARAAPTPPKLVDRLEQIRAEVLELESGLLTGLQSKRRAQQTVAKIETLIRLQNEERELGRQRMIQLEKTIGELEKRRSSVSDRIRQQKNSLRRFLIGIDRSIRTGDFAISKEKLEAPRRRVLTNMIDMGIKELEAFRVDLADSETLESKILEEKQQLVYLFQDLKEQESVLELNRQLQVDILRKQHQERLAQLESYRKLKDAEGNVQRLIENFNARLELDQAVRTERVVSKAMRQGVFARLQGKLPLPVPAGKVISSFGKTFDPKSRLHIFKKGVDVSAGRNQQVQAIAAGKVAFSGELPNYGKVVILDHGEHYYTLCANLGALGKKAGDPVGLGEKIGATDDLGTPVYFEIRARNVAVNPLQWLLN
ncbi:MAG: hypothetical protein A2X94_00055 [Bdellovibrionales bacterium GWB1_55_8]|nr:MAG: hypothetical protein A2X94_00055 [Bdellovibrionales bacterium GWB1_55_8]